MNVRNKLRNSLIRKIQMLSTDKLTELSKELNKIESKFKSKEETLKLAGSWSDLSEDLFSDLTEDLHTRRSNDRQIL
ncbi:hypothetical protein [Roseivirga sp.]|uniref:hypothetical protein n=1 Tax=Roseivirga sp. TaxID=1964215 RepID=UPI002B26B753|nr:hypothetical protein [Roseivirga sp.]